eukprot:744499-Prorocentrum_minimum.AAC.1
MTVLAAALLLSTSEEAGWTEYAACGPASRGDEILQSTSYDDGTTFLVLAHTQEARLNPRSKSLSPAEQVGSLHLLRVQARAWRGSLACEAASHRPAPTPSKSRTRP